MSNLPINDNGDVADVCLIEVGGTVGDIESMVFLEAIRQLMKRVGRQNAVLCHVSLVPVIGVVGYFWWSGVMRSEQKTKPTQTTVKELRSTGLSPDFLICRAATPLEEVGSLLPLKPRTQSRRSLSSATSPSRTCWEFRT